MAIQNWNLLISYIRHQLGSINQLELTDDELINHIRDHTLLEFSSHSSDKLWVLITDADRMKVEVDSSGNIAPDRIMDADTFVIPLPNETDYIINVEDAYYRRSTSDGYDEYPYFYQSDPRDIVMNNTMSTMLAYLDSVQYYQYQPPNTITFGKPINQEGVILELNIMHNNLDRIKRDVYQNYFRKLALFDIIEMIIANRSKFREVSSPFGPINLNIEFLERKMEKLEREIEEYRQWEVPEKMVAWVD
jgi:hypothetical protein